jgi:hypothetical protein
MQVENSNAFQVGDIIRLIPEFSRLPSYELALVKEIPSPTEIKLTRGIHGTTSLSHNSTSVIRNLGPESLEQDLVISTEPEQPRAAIYSLGFGFQMLLEPQLHLTPGNYNGTITFTLYTCTDPSCL